MKIIVNTSSNRLHLESGRYNLKAGERKPLYDNDENCQGVMLAVMRGWAEIQDVDEPLSNFTEKRELTPTIKFEEETVVSEPTPSEGSKPIQGFIEETYDAKGELISGSPETEPTPPKTSRSGKKAA